jgi:hypothetical protein
MSAPETASVIVAALAGPIAGYFIGFGVAARQFVRTVRTWADERAPRTRDYDLEEAIMEHCHLVRQMERGADGRQ